MKVPIRKSLFRVKIILLFFVGVSIAAATLIFQKRQIAHSEPTEAFIFDEEASKLPATYSDFNPNDLKISDWENLGFSNKQAETILKYKAFLGGRFRSKEELRRCFVISEESFQKLKDYILLPDIAENSNSEGMYSNTHAYQKRIRTPQKMFNPDLYTQEDWENLGFSEKQTAAILKYKNYLGGSFQSKQKLKECFVIGNEQYSKIEPFLILPDDNNDTFSKNEFKVKEITNPIENAQHTNFDPNDLDLEGWQKLGFSEKQAQVILNYKNRNLRGKFENLDQIRSCFVISEKKFEELKPLLRIEKVENPIESAEVHHPEKKAQTKTDFSKVDLNEITFNQLVEFGFDSKVAGNIISFRKKLGGFVNENQIFETYNLDRIAAEELISKTYLDSKSVEKYSLVDAPESWLKTHPYFKNHADKIIYIRLSRPEEKKIWKFIEARPEQQVKMKMYLETP